MKLATLLSLFLPLLSFGAPSGRMIELRGSINPGSAAFILENIEAAEREKSSLLLIRLDTPGGLLSSTRDIIQAIAKSRVPVVVYVSPSGASATSAGALIGLSAHVLAMAPGTNIGAAHPVGSGGEEVKGAMGEKVTNDTAALARAQATLRGRSGSAAEEIVTKSRSFSAEEAVKAQAADLVAGDVDELLRKIDRRQVALPETQLVLETKELSLSSLVAGEMRLQQKVLHFLSDPNISALLMALGGIALYAEISSGFTVALPGLFGLFCMILAFVSLQTLPVNIGGALLFALGFGLLIAEVYITSFGLLTIAALASLLLGGLFLMDPAASEMRVSLSILLPMVGGIGAVALFIGYLIARDAKRAKLPVTDRAVGHEAKVKMVEAGGMSGTAYVGGELWSFRSDSSLSPGDSCKVARVEGLIVILERRT